MHMPLLKELQLENKRLKEDLNSLIPSVLGEGENIILNGTAEARFKKLIVKGNTVQNGEPSLDNPIDIRNVGDNINLLNVNDIEETTNYGITYSTKNDIIHIDGSLTTTATITIVDDFELDDGNYTISSVLEGEYLKGSSSDNSLIFLQYKTGDSYTTKKELALKQSGFTFSAEKGTYRIRIYFSKGNEFKNVVMKLKLEKGTVATPYSPYNCGNVNFKITDDGEQEQQFTFPLKEGQVLHKEDYLADDGIHHKSRQVVIDGTENWHMNGNNLIAILEFTPENYGAKSGDTIIAPVISNYYPSAKHQDIYFQRVDYGISLGSDYNIAGGICIYNKNLHGLDEYKANFAELYANGTPVIVEYELLNEQIEPYTPEQKEAYNKLKNLRSYKDVTHIYSDDEISPIFEIEAYKDIQAEIDNLKNK